MCRDSTPVKRLCPACRKKRRLILDRIRHRSPRTRRTSGAVVLSPQQVDAFVSQVDQLERIQQAVLEELIEERIPLQGEMLEMFGIIADLKAGVEPAFAATREERAELNRPD